MALSGDCADIIDDGLGSKHQSQYSLLHNIVNFDGHRMELETFLCTIACLESIHSRGECGVDHQAKVFNQGAIKR